VAATEEFYRQLGVRVEEARRRRGLTQAALGKRLSPPQTRASISNIEKGTQRVLAHTLVQLATALDVPLTELTPAPAPPRSSSNVGDALAQKLQLPRKELRKLLAQLEPGTKSDRS
jgi:transcriptional regulator with XRE-family HTH domain